MVKEMEQQLGLPELESKITETILRDLYPHLTSHNWTLVGGLPFRYYYLQKTGRAWQSPFNDLDIISPFHSVLQPEVSKQFQLRHHHFQGKEDNFYFQLNHKEFSRITIDIFSDPIPGGQEAVLVDFFGLPVKIVTIEEMYLFKLRDILLCLDSPRGLPPKHIEQLRFLAQAADKGRVESLWERRHQETPSLGIIYQFVSLKEAKQAAEEKLTKRRDNIKDWTKSDPFKPCEECISDPHFSLLRELR